MSSKPKIVLFSSSDEDTERERMKIRRRQQQSQPVHIQIEPTSAAESINDSSTFTTTEVSDNSNINDETPEGYSCIEFNMYGLLKPNTLIQYKTTDGTIIKSKYFKKLDLSKKQILVGFGRKVYPVSFDSIEVLWAKPSIKGGNEEPEGMDIEIPDLKRGMIISYINSKNEWIKNVEFLSFLDNDKIAMISNNGYSFKASKTSMKKVVRHLSPNDHLQITILKKIKNLEIQLDIMNKQILHLSKKHSQLNTSHKK